MGLVSVFSYKRRQARNIASLKDLRGQRGRGSYYIGLGCPAHLSCSYCLVGITKGECWPQEPPGPVPAPGPPGLSVVSLDVILTCVKSTYHKPLGTLAAQPQGLRTLSEGHRPGTFHPSGVLLQSIQMGAWSVQPQL